MNRKILFCIAAFILFIPLFSAAETVEIDKDILEKILQQQRELKKSVETLQLQLDARKNSPAATQPEPSAPPLAEDVEYLKDEVEYMSGRLDSTEKKSILDKVQIGGEFRVRGDWLNFDNMKDAEGVEKDGRIDELWSTRLRLHLRSEITENLIFNGRLTYLKYWGETNYDEDALDSRHFMTSDPDGDLHVERAYIDWFIPDTPFSITAGRLPASNGPPYEFKNYTPRKSDWAKFILDGEFDGIIFNADLKKWTGLKTSMTRIGYSKLSQNYRNYQGFNMDDSRGLFLNFETTCPGVDNSLLWLVAYKIWDLSALNSIPGLPDGAYPSDSGEMEGVFFHLQFNNIMNTGLGWFGACGYTWYHPRPEGTVLAPSYEVGLIGDSLHGDLGKERRGYNFFTGLRYILPIASLKNPHIGLEYLYNSKYATLLASFSPGEFTNKVGVNGHAYELYYLQPIIEKHMFARIGAVYQDFDYYSPLSIFGSREVDEVKSDMSILNTYFLVDVRF